VEKTVIDFLVKSATYDTAEWTRQSEALGPQQRPGSLDCGVYMCQFVKWLIQGIAIPSAFPLEDCARFRNMMILELVAGELRYSE
jgi:Ulp1 family protease